MSFPSEKARKKFFATNKSISIKSTGTVEVLNKGSLAKGIDPSEFNIERLKGTDDLVVREKGRQHGIITTADDLDRVLIHLEKQKKARLIQEAPQKSKQKGLQL